MGNFTKTRMAVARERGAPMKQCPFSRGYRGSDCPTSTEIPCPVCGTLGDDGAEDHCIDSGHHNDLPDALDMLERAMGVVRSAAGPITLDAWVGLSREARAILAAWEGKDNG